MAAIAKIESVSVVKMSVTEMSPETSAVFVEAFTGESNANRNWLRGFRDYFVEHCDDKGIIDPDFHPDKQPVADRLFCETMDSDVARAIGKTVGDEGRGRSRASQAFSGCLLKSRSGYTGDDAVHGFLTVVNKSKIPNNANKGGKLKVNPEVVDKLLSDPDWKFVAKAPTKADETLSNDANVVAKVVGKETAKRLTNIVKLVPTANLIECKITDPSDPTKKTTRNGALPTEDQDSMIASACTLLARIAPDMLSTDGLTKAVSAT